MRPSPVDMSETVVPFTSVRAEKLSNDQDPLDQAGQSIMGLLQQAATTAKENCGRALGVAHRFQDRAARAENWLQRIPREIETRFFEPNDGHQQQHSSARQNGPYSRRV
jgi:hypothetical protein